MSQIFALKPVWLHNVSPALSDPLFRLISSSLDHAAIFREGWPLFLVKNLLISHVIRGELNNWLWKHQNCAAIVGKDTAPPQRLHHNMAQLLQDFSWENPYLHPGRDLSKFTPQGDSCKPSSFWVFGQPGAVTDLKRLNSFKLDKLKFKKRIKMSTTPVVNICAIVTLSSKLYLPWKFSPNQNTNGYGFLFLAAEDLAFSKMQWKNFGKNTSSVFTRVIFPRAQPLNKRESNLFF